MRYSPRLFVSLHLTSLFESLQISSTFDTLVKKDISDWSWSSNSIIMDTSTLSVNTEIYYRKHYALPIFTRLLPFVVEFGSASQSSSSWTLT